MVISNRIYFQISYYYAPTLVLNRAQPYVLSILSSAVPDPSSSLILVNTTTTKKKGGGGGVAAKHCLKQEPTKVLLGSVPVAAEAAGSFLGSNGPLQHLCTISLPLGEGSTENDGESPFSSLSQWWLTQKIKISLFLPYTPPDNVPRQ